MNVPGWLDWSDESINSNNKEEKFYKYTYGVKDIQVRYKEFSKASVFVSKPYQIDGNIMEVSLTTDEANYALKNTNNATSPFDTTTEYYITFSEHPRPEEWIPILPTNQGIVNEYLFMNETRKGYLRFKCDPTKEIIVYKNGVRIPEEHWSFCLDNSIVIDRYFDKYAIYTVTYSPNILASNPWNIELRPQDREIVPYISPDGSIGEVFKNGTDRNGVLLLDKTPFIDYGRINADDNSYNPIEVVLENGKIAGPNKTTFSTVTKDTTPKTKNMTDYKGLSEVALLPYDCTLSGNVMAHPYFEYLQDGRKLYFTETFSNSSIVSNMPTNHGDATVRVKYDYIRSQFRIKAILRNVSSSTASITPSISSYSLIFKVMR